jgi:hypothetical protein
MAHRRGAHGVRDGCHYYYDINALSNFVADAENVVGFDPWETLVDYLEARSRPGTRRPGATEKSAASAPSASSASFPQVSV